MMFIGTGVALVTPFLANGAIDFPALENLVNHVIENGVEYVVALGTTAETPTLEPAEKEHILDTIIKTVDGRVPIVCGIGGNHTHEVMKQIKAYESKAIDAILSVCPYYNKPTQNGIYAHFSAIAEATKKPIILYNVPGRTVSNILPETVVHLAQQHRNIVAIKEASGNMAQVMELVRIKPENFTVLSGDDNLVVPQIAIGFKGVISVAANCYTRLFTDMVRFALNENFTAARDNHYKLLEGIDLLFAEGNPAGVKYVLHKMNLMQNHLRLPLVPVSAGLANKIEAYRAQL